MPPGAEPSKGRASRIPRRKRTCRDNASSNITAMPANHAIAMIARQSTPALTATGATDIAAVALSIAGTRTTTVCVAACGSWLAISASTGSHHNRQACSMPNARRHGNRSAATISSAALRASVAVHNRCRRSIALIVELPDQALQFRDVLLRQLALFAEMRDQRRHASAEQAVQQALALLQHVAFPHKQRAIEIAPTITRGFHRALAQQPVQQRLHRAFLPTLARADLGEDLLGAAGRPSPQHLHDFALGFADRLGHDVYMRNR